MKVKTIQDEEFNRKLFLHNAGTSGLIPEGKDKWGGKARHAEWDNRNIYKSQTWLWLEGGKEKSPLRIWAKAGILSGTRPEITLPEQPQQPQQRI